MTPGNAYGPQPGGDVAGATAPAAGDAARDAARDAAWDAAWAAAKPTVVELQASALDLLNRIIDPERSEGER